MGNIEINGFIEAGPKSDVDLIFKFLCSKDLLAFLRLKYEIPEVVGRKFDLLTGKIICLFLLDEVLNDTGHI